MKISKGMLVLVTGFAFAGVASAEDAAAPAAAAPAATAAAPAVKSEVKSPIQQLLPGAYSSLEMRHTTLRNMNHDQVVNDATNISARPTIGTSLFDGKVDTSFTWIFTKYSGTTAVTKTDVYNDTFITALDSEKAGSLKLEVYTYQNPNANRIGDGRFEESDISLNFESPPSWEIPTAAGKFGLYLFSQVAGVALTNGKDQPVDTVGGTNGHTREEFGLAAAPEGGDDTKVTTPRRDPQLFNITYIQAYTKPVLVEGLRLSVGTEADTIWTPRYEAEEAGANDNRIKLAGYKVYRGIINKYGVSYKLSDKVSVINQLRQNIGGYYAEGLNSDKGSRWENRLILNATLL